MMMNESAIALPMNQTNDGMRSISVVEGIPSGDVERHPATEEEEGSDTCHNKEVEIFSKIEESEVDTGIFSVVAGGELTFGLRQVKRATVGFGGTSDQVDDERR